MPPGVSVARGSRRAAQVPPRVIATVATSTSTVPGDHETAARARTSRISPTRAAIARSLSVSASVSSGSAGSSTASMP